MRTRRHDVHMPESDLANEHLSSVMQEPETTRRTLLNQHEYASRIHAIPEALEKHISRLLTSNLKLDVAQRNQIVALPPDQRVASLSVLVLVALSAGAFTSTQPETSTETRTSTIAT